MSSLSVIAIIGTYRLGLELQTIDEDDIDKYDNSVLQEHVPRFKPDVVTWCSGTVYCKAILMPEHW